MRIQAERRSPVVSKSLPIQFIAIFKVLIIRELFTSARNVKQQNVNKYIKSNFFRILLFFGRGTMQVSQDVFRFVPLQNFTDESYIDWSKSISEIDTQLYAKYKLSDEEISFIESMTK